MRKDIILTVFVSMLLLSSMVSMQFVASVRAVTTWTVMIDLYTQKSGKGPNQAGGYFKPQELVILYAHVTNNTNPISNKSVAFEIHGPPDHPKNITIIRAPMTNASGMATINFRIPWPDEDPEDIVLGTWTAYAGVQIGEEKVNDTLTFMVGFSVGGVWIPVNKLELLAPYIGLTILLAIAVITVGYVKNRKRNTEILPLTNNQRNQMHVELVRVQ